MNKSIEQLFANFKPDDNAPIVPIAFLQYQGDAEAYVTYNSSGDDPALSGDNALIQSVIAYDFHVFSKGNYDTIIAAVKALLTNAGWVWTGSSEDLYEPDTQYYHKVNSFEIERSY